MPVFKLLGLLAFLIDRFHRNVAAAAREFEAHCEKRRRAKHLAWLRTLDPGALRENGDIGSIILARQAEIAQRG